MTDGDLVARVIAVLALAVNLALFLRTILRRHRQKGCHCTSLCSMGPTCPGGMLAGLPDSGCWRSSDSEGSTS